MINYRLSVVAVLGYGCHLTPEVRDYLDRVVAFVKGRINCVIILTGGFTDKRNAPGISEARMMELYLKERGVTQEIILDETARTTNENITAINRIMHERGYAQCADVDIFCDWAHQFKVKFAAGRTSSIPTCHYLTHSVTKGFARVGKQLIIATLLCWIANRIPFFQRLEVLRKQWLQRIK